MTTSRMPQADMECSFLFFPLLRSDVTPVALFPQRVHERLLHFRQSFKRPLHRQPPAALLRLTVAHMTSPQNFFSPFSKQLEHPVAPSGKIRVDSRNTAGNSGAVCASIAGAVHAA